MEFDVVQGDIADMAADAMVNAANTDLQMDAGVAAALREAGGEALAEAAVAAGPVAVGEAVPTDAYDLDAAHVVHAAAMEPDGRASTESVRDATRNALRIADELGCASLVLPAIGTGVGGLSLDTGARVVCEVLAAYEPRSLRAVRFVAYGDEDYEVVRDVAQTVRDES